HFIAGKLLDIEWNIQRHEPAWMVHLPDRTVALSSDNKDVLDKFPETAKFWKEQSRIADIAWKLSAQGLPFPPQDLAELIRLAKVGLLNFPRDLQILPFVFATVKQWARWNGLGENREFLRFLDAT